MLQTLIDKVTSFLVSTRCEVDNIPGGQKQFVPPAEPVSRVKTDADRRIRGSGSLREERLSAFEEPSGV